MLARLVVLAEPLPDRPAGAQHQLGPAGEVLGRPVPAGLHVADVRRVEAHVGGELLLRQPPLRRHSISAATNASAAVSTSGSVIASPLDVGFADSLTPRVGSWTERDGFLTQPLTDVAARLGPYAMTVRKRRISPARQCG